MDSRGVEMKDHDPTYGGVFTTATYPDVEMVPGPPKLPVHIEAYYQIKRRALIMQLRALNKLLGIDKENGKL